MFHLRNPTALQDDFWSILINVWISAFSCISQIVYHLMPGREGIDIYICSGRFPLHYLSTPVKINYPAFLTVVLSLLIHLSFAILTHTFKHCVKDKFSKYENYKTQWANVTTKENMYHYSSQLGGIMLVSGIIIYPSRILFRLHPAVLDSYPFYLWYYIQTNMAPQCAVNIYLFLFLSRNARIQKKVWQELKNIYWVVIDLIM